MTKHIKKTSSPTLPPYIEQKLTSLVLDNTLQDSVLQLREALLETFYPAHDDRCPMCGGSGLYRYMVGARTIEEGCDECDGTGRTKRGLNAARMAMALEIICGRRMAPDDDTAKMPAAEFAAAVLDDKILNGMTPA